MKCPLPSIKTSDLNGHPLLRMFLVTTLVDQSVQHAVDKNFPQNWRLWGEVALHLDKYSDYIWQAQM